MAPFITFEGGEGSGKTTQARALYRRLLQSGIAALLCREPGGTSVGREVRRLLKRPTDTGISPQAELFLVAASRAQLVQDLILPSLAVGTAIICDRYAHSTLAYQGYGRGISLEDIHLVNNVATRGLLPDLVVLLDIPVEVGLARKASARRDRFEEEEVAFHERVRDGYLSMARADPQRWLVIDAALPRGEIRSRVWDEIEGLF